MARGSITSPDGRKSLRQTFETGLRHTGSALRRFWSERAAIGAVEFALVAPFLLILYMGGSEVAIGVTINRKVHHAASTVDDLISQVTSVSKADIDGIFAISGAIVGPYDTSKVRLKVTSVHIDSQGKATVDWSHATANTTADKPGDPFALPAEFSTMTDHYLLVAVTQYNYVPLGGYGLTQPIQMGETAYLNPRIGDKVTCTDCAS